MIVGRNAPTSVIYLRLFASGFSDLRAKNVWFVIADENIGYPKECESNWRGSDSMKGMVA